MGLKKIQTKKPREYNFKPGISGNPNGRPKGSVSVITELKKLLEETPKGEKKTQAIQIAEKILDMAKTGDREMLKLICNYTDGLPKQPLTGIPDEPIQIKWIQ